MSKPKRSLEDGKRTNYVTTGGAGYVPPSNPGGIAQILRNRAYRNVNPTGYTLTNALLFFGDGKRRMFGNPNTEGLWGLYTGQDSIIAHSGQAPEGLALGRPLTKTEIISYGYDPDDLASEDLAKYAVKDIVIPSKSKKGAYELAYPNQSGNVQHLPSNSNNVPNDRWLHSHQLGTFNQIKGKDKKGTYVVYKDTWDINPFKGQSSEDDSSWKWFIKAGKKIGLDKVGDIVPFGKPFEVHGKQYYDKNGLPRKRKASGGSIHIAPSKRGTFTAAATKHGMGVQEFASRVLRNKETYSPAMVKKANFARNASKWNH